MRPADTLARGSITLMREIIRNAAMICIVYWMKAIMSPTCMLPASMLPAPTHRISTHTPFMASIIMGIMPPMSRPTNSWVLRSAVEAASKRSSSRFWVTNARMTGRPVRVSRMTRFTRSICSCIRLKRGRPSAKSTPTMASTSATPTAMTHAMERLVSSARMMPPTPRIGA